MIVPYGASPGERIMDPEHPKELHNMKWETPEAIDMRYGMEITMYISNR